MTTDADPAALLASTGVLDSPDPESVEDMTERLTATVSALRQERGEGEELHLDLLRNGYVVVRREDGSSINVPDRAAMPEADYEASIACIESRLIEIDPLAVTRAMRSLLTRRAQLLDRGADIADTLVLRLIGGYWVRHVAGGTSALLTPSGHLESTTDTFDFVDLVYSAWIAWGMPRTATICVVGPSRVPARYYSVENYELGSWVPAEVPVTAYAPLMRSDAAAELPEGSDPVTLALHHASTSGRRHQSRVRATQAALYQYVLGEAWPAGRHGCAHPSVQDVGAWVRLEDSSPSPTVPATLTSEQQHAVCTIAAIDIHGIGGPGGYSGDASARMSWASQLGSGRRQASDGGAWIAAAQAIATERPTPADVIAALYYISPSDLEYPLAYALAQISAWKANLDEATAWCEVARAVMREVTSPFCAEDHPALALGMRYGL